MLVSLHVIGFSF